MLVHRLRRWPNMKSALVQRLVFAGRVGIPGGNVQAIWSCLVGVAENIDKYVHRAQKALQLWER